MKYMVISDIHGCVEFTNKAIEIFKKEFGISPKKYIINARIKHAVGLIENGYYSLSEIAEMSGFTDYKYFSSEFRRVMGTSPSKYHYDF